MESYELLDYVPPDRKYWFIRTQGGLYYDEFASSGFVAINWDELDDPIRLLSMSKEDAFEVIKEAYPNEERPGKVFNLFNRFYYEMHEGDIVMIPSDSSKKIMFGEIKSGVYIGKPSNKEGCPFVKRRKVEWLKVLDRDKMDPYLYRMTRPHNTISDASEYGPYIDRSIGSFFVKGNKANLIIPIKTKEDISAVDLYNFMDLIFSTIPIVNESGVLDKKYTRADLDIKLNLQSPGIMQYIASPELMTAIGAVLVFIVGGAAKIKWTKEVKEGEVSSEGLVGKIFDFILKRKDQEIEIMKLQQQNEALVKKLEYELPKEIAANSANSSEPTAISDTETKSE